MLTGSLLLIQCFQPLEGMDSGAWHGFTTLRSTYNRSERNALYSELMFAEDLDEYCVCASDPPPFKPLVKKSFHKQTCAYL